MRFIGVELLLMFMSVAVFGLLVVALVDLLRRPNEAWVRSGHSQLVWALVVIFVAVIGPVLYLAIARPALVNVDASPVASPRYS